MTATLNTIRALWNDTRGSASAMAWILITTIVAFGAIVGLTELRNQIIQEMGDIAVALESVNQSFTSACGTFTDTPTTLTDPIGAAPACIDLLRPASIEP